MGGEISPEELKKREEMVISMCICPSCPSWVECGEKGGYCFETISKRGGISEENGCICLGFPVANKLRLDYMY
ncbi:hypothetical protein MSMTP_1525 [Methanosarcina sp. MTP4]|uniref:DUF2769 domain-containing protein n=1 Tax=Methanosarcina sp. MTP4 TaxID=1434100 RepID=UPI000615B610|nr:DUF2769 domain-containing protein [Methanosarcina sp. MTP4]AKB24994.1 hypothetical protein MSMTP_1525 [Methanosarcina sp. MTP4]